MPQVSIVITTHNRPELLRTTLWSLYNQNYWDIYSKNYMQCEVVVVDDGIDGTTETMCRSYFPDVVYIKTNRPPTERYSNPARPNNIGIRAAKGEYIILQNAECKHVSKNVIEKLVEATTPTTVAIAGVVALDNSGQPLMWYTHGEFNPRPFFFCGCILRSHLMEINGFDEDYKFYGMDDVDLADRLKLKGVEFTYHNDILVHHQWHPSSHNPADPGIMINGQLYNEKTEQMIRGDLGIVRNLGKDWGTL